MSKRLRCLGLEADVISRLQRHNLITCKDVLSRSYLDLVNLLNISYYTVLDIIQKASQATAPTPTTALELLQSRQRVNSRAFLRTSLNLLDSVLKGGIPVSTITEVAGPSGCGKTQFCLMMAINTLMSEENCGVIYIDTETAFSAHRQTDEVDSIASLVRKEYDISLSRNMIERTKLLSKQAAILKFYAENYTVPVLVTNQVTTHFGHKAVAEDEPQIEDTDGVQGQTEGYITVALGNTWSHCVNTRLILQYVDGARREILLAKSPLAPFTKFVYTIQESGIVTEDEGADHYDGTDPGLQVIRVRSTAACDIVIS